MPRWLSHAVDRAALLPRSLAEGEPLPFRAPTTPAETLLGPAPPPIDLAATAVPTRHGLAWSLPTPAPSGIVENDTLYLSLHRCGRTDAPLVVLVPPWRSVSRWPFAIPLGALAQEGCDVLFVEIPYHLRRVPRGQAAGDAFVGGDLEQVALAHRQGTLELWQVLLSAGSLGYQRVGIYGLSLGGLLAALALTVCDRVDLAGLVAPPDDPLALLDHSALGRRYGARLMRQGIPAPTVRAALTALAERIAPSRRTPLVRRERVLIGVGRHDLIVPEPITAPLAARFGSPVSRFERGHIGMVFCEGGFARHFAERLRGE